MKKLLYAFVNRDAANTTLAMAQKTNAMFKGFIVGKIVDSSIIGVLCFLGHGRCSSYPTPCLSASS